MDVQAHVLRITCCRVLCRGNGPTPTGCKMANLTGNTLVGTTCHLAPCCSMRYCDTAASGVALTASWHCVY
jgi:hypothetical protein